MAVPTNSTYSNGVSVLSGDQLNSFQQVCSTAAALRNFIGLANMGVDLLGAGAPGDGNGGAFYWNAASTAPDDGYNVIVPNGVTVGAWLRTGSVLTTAYFTALLASPPPIGNVTPNTGAFTTLSSTTLSSTTLSSTSTLTAGGGTGTTNVNWMTLAGSASGSGPTITAAGGDTNITVRVVPKGTGVLESQFARFGTANGSPSVFGNSTVFNVRFNPTYSAGVAANSGVLVQENIAGNVTVGSPILNLFTVNSDSISGAPAVDGWVFGHTISTGATGGRVGLNVSFNHTGATTTGAGVYYVAQGITATSSASAGGTLGTRAGDLFSMNNYTTLRSGAGAYWNSLVGQEIDVAVNSGAGVLYKRGLQIVQFNNSNDVDASAGSIDDAGFSFVNQANNTTAAVGWQTGISFGSALGWWPIQATGTMIGTLAASNPYTLVQATTGASGTGTVATLTYAGAYAYPIGSTITVAGVTPAGFNGAHVVTASSSGSVSWAASTTGPQTVAGTITGASGPAYYAADGVDFSAVTFSGSAFKSSGFSVGPAGDVTLSGSTGALIAKSSQITTGNIVLSGTSNNQQAYLGQITLTGKSGATQTSPNQFSIADSANYYGANYINGIGISVNTGGSGTAGSRTGIRSSVNATSLWDPGAAQNGASPFLVGVLGLSNSTVPLNGIIRDTGSGNGTLQGASFNATATGASGLQAVVALEIGTTMDSGSSAQSHRGLSLTVTGTKRGVFDDTALPFVGDSTSSWKTVISFGENTRAFPASSDSTLVAVRRRRSGGTNTPTVLRGIDFTELTTASGGFPFGSVGFGVDASGQVYGNAVTTTGTVQAQSAGIASMTVTDGGTFLSKPTITIQTSPTGGTNAAATVNAMGGILLGPAGVLFGASGRLYTNGEVGTPQGGTGTAPTFTLTADGSGSVTALAIATNGAWTHAPANPIQVNGGTSGQTSAFINITSYTSASGFFVPQTWELASSGWGLSPGALVTVVGDTGTAIIYAAATVTADGGILTVTINTVGSVTVIAGGTYHTTDVGNCKLGVGYTILSVTVGTAGTGYSTIPPPWVLLTQTIYPVATLTPVMSASAATLSLNPSGGSVSYQGGPTISSGSGAPVSTEPKGSIYMRTGGGVGTTLYATQGGGVWNAVAGV